MHHPSIHVLGILTMYAWNIISLSLLFFELKLCLQESKNISVALQGARDPALLDFYLIVLSSNFDFPSCLLNFNPIGVALDHYINLGSHNIDGAVVEYEMFLKHALLIDDDLTSIGMDASFHWVDYYISLLLIFIYVNILYSVLFYLDQLHLTNEYNIHMHFLQYYSICRKFNIF